MQYIKLQVTDAAGAEFEAYQVIEDGLVVRHVDANGAPVVLPAVHEARVVIGAPLPEALLADPQAAPADTF